MVRRVGDSPDNEADLIDRFDLHLNADFMNFLSSENMSVAFTTYEGGKLIIVGPGYNGAIVAERNFTRCMALYIEDQNIWVSTEHNILQLENGLEKGQYWENQWDRLYLPRSSHFTGGVDAHEILRANDGYLYGVITGHNCIARIDYNDRGSFSPYWKPPFINNIITGDRCHLNGLCLEDGELAYVSIVAETTEPQEWKKHREDGGIIIDIRKDEIIASGLSMPHTPRVHEGVLWFLEAGKGYLCRYDPKTKGVERVLWRPGFLRGLHFYKKYAFICSSAPRNKVFEGLPLQEELKERDVEPRCALDVINMETMELAYSINITGHVKEIYDVALLMDCRQPLLHGFMDEDIKKIVVFGDDLTELGALNNRPKPADVLKS